MTRCPICSRGRSPRRLASIAGILLCAVASVATGCVSRSPAGATAQRLQEGPSVDDQVREIYELGRAYETGRGVPQDLAHAVALYQEASARGERRASERLGLLAARGEITLDDNRTYDRLLVASLHNSEPAQLELARMRATGGEGVARDVDGAVATLSSMTRNGNADAMVALAKIYADPGYSGVDYQAAMTLLTQAYARGKLDAAVELARIHANPAAPAHDPAEAMRWARTAVDGGDARGWAIIGRIAADPMLPTFDPAVAEDALRQAIAGGDLNAPVDLAKLMENTGRPNDAMALYLGLIADGRRELGYEVGRMIDDRGGADRGTAYAYLEMAFAAGRDAAPRRLLNLLEDGVPDPDGDYGAALGIVSAWVDSSNDPELAYRLGRVFESGTVGVADARMAFVYFERAADGGHSEGAIRAARLIQRQPGLADAATASMYLRRAASLGDIGALTELGQLQEERGDHAAAAETYLAAARAGDGNAVVRLARLAEAHPGLVDEAVLRSTLEGGAATGSPAAMVRLADLAIDSGSEEDREAAVEHLYRAAELGNTDALRRLGDLAIDGVAGMGPADAIAFYESALNAGDERAAYRLLRTVAQHAASPADYQRALDFVDRTSYVAADPVAQYWRGVVLVKLGRREEAITMLLGAYGEGVDGALEELVALSETDPELGSTLQAQLEQHTAGASGCEVGRFLLIRAEQATRSADGQDAIGLYHQALQAGWYLAAERLGGLYMTGLDTQRPDFPTAYAYFAIASDAGIIGAREQLENLTAAMDPEHLGEARRTKDEVAAGLPTPCRE